MGNKQGGSGHRAQRIFVFDKFGHISIQGDNAFQAIPQGQSQCHGQNSALAEAENVPFARINGISSGGVSDECLQLADRGIEALPVRIPQSAQRIILKAPPRLQAAADMDTDETGPYSCGKPGHILLV
ncbi:hypothetical protein D3C75_926270 [compost metagenome]